MTPRTTLLLVLSLLAAAARAAEVDVFGDSLSDVGNVYAASGGTYPASPYFNGRFSNGPLWVEDVAAAQGATLAPSFLGGTDYAVGGAKTGAGLTDLLTQVDSYRNARTGSAANLYVVLAGGNDYLSGTPDVPTTVGNVRTAIERLYDAGGRRFLVPNLPLLGNVPKNVGTANQAGANALAAAHNLALRNAVALLRASKPGIAITELDTAALFESARANPGAYGLTNVSAAAYANGAVAPGVAGYLFWDDIHPTRNGHRLLGAEANRLLAVPEPATLAALALGAAALLRRRRRA